MKKIFVLIAITTALLFVVSCSSVPEIPEDLTARQLMQQGQTAMGSSRHKAAEHYFKTTLERFGTDAETYVEAKYELGHLYMKTKNYDSAYNCFTEILQVYEIAPEGSLLPDYKKLAQLQLNKIPQSKLDELKSKS